LLAPKIPCKEISTEILRFGFVGGELEARSASDAKPQTAETMNGLCLFG